MEAGAFQSLRIDRSPPAPLSDAEFAAWMSEQVVFVSSVMDGTAAERESARAAIEALGGTAAMFERMGGRDEHARTTYLNGVRTSDLYICLLGERYGMPGLSGLSPTHEEYRAAVLAGLRISAWAANGERESRQQAFLDEIRKLHTTGRYSDAADLREGLTRLLREMATAATSPFCKMGHVLFRPSRFIDDGTQITIAASVRDDGILADLERLRPQKKNRRRPSPITHRGRTHAALVDSVKVDARAGRPPQVTIEAAKVDGPAPSILGVEEGRPPADIVELGIRAALLGERNVLGDTALMTGLSDAMAAIDRIGLDDDSFAAAAEVVLVELLVGSGLAERVTALRIGPARSGRHIQLEWETPRRARGTEPQTRRIEGKLTVPAGCVKGSV